MANIVSIIILAICSTVAVFADVESTGNLSMALNGAGVAQLVTCVALAYLYFQQLKNSNSVWNRQSTREKIGYAMVAVIFAICMIIGKEQTAHEDLKFAISRAISSDSEVVYILANYTATFAAEKVITDYRKEAGHEN